MHGLRNIILYFVGIQLERCLCSVNACLVKNIFEKMTLALAVFFVTEVQSCDLGDGLSFWFLCEFV